MRQYLRSSSFFLLFLLGACSPYSHLNKMDKTAGMASAFRFQPMFLRQLYRCVVDGQFLFKKFHLSGLLFFKAMDDGSTRVVLQNEMGFALFDFSWTNDSLFTVKSIIPQLNKPAVIKTLRKDLELFMMKGLEKDREVYLIRNYEMLHRFPVGNGYVYYIESSNQVRKIVNTGKRKTVTTIFESNRVNSHAMPDSVFIDHRRAHFTIDLNKIKDVAQ